MDFTWNPDKIKYTQLLQYLKSSWYQNHRWNLSCEAVLKNGPPTFVASTFGLDQVSIWLLEFHSRCFHLCFHVVLISPPVVGPSHPKSCQVQTGQTTSVFLSSAYPVSLIVWVQRLAQPAFDQKTFEDGFPSLLPSTRPTYISLHCSSTASACRGWYILTACHG